MVEKVTYSGLVTGEQYPIVYHFAGATKENLPRGKKQSTLLSPPGEVYFRVTISPYKSTYGKRLYLVEHCKFTAD